MDPRQCPWCKRWCLKDLNCNYIFACGLSERGFVIDAGCGRSWCWECGKKFCGLYYDSQGKKISNKTHHDMCCTSEEGFSKDQYCPGGHNSHCNTRW